MIIKPQVDLVFDLYGCVSKGLETIVFKNLGNLVKLGE